MQKIRWILTTVVGVALSLMWTFYVVSATEAQTEPPLDIEIIVAQTEVVLGAPMTWRIILTPCAQVSIDSLELRPGDARTWAWPDGFQAVGGLTNTVVLDVAAVPLVSGDLHPILEAHYIAGGEMQTQLVMGGTPVHVESVEKLVEAGVIARRGTVRKGDRLPVELWIRNGSPFTLTQVQLDSSSADLPWELQAVLADIPPHKTVRRVLAFIVGGQHPQPRLSVDYAWTDATGSTHSQTMHISGEPVAIEESLIGRIPNEVFGIIVGLTAGVLSTFFTGLIGDWLSRVLQKKVNRRHVQGLLRLMILQSEHAASNGVDVNLAPLETVFKEEGLFTVLERDKLAQHVRDLWRKAERHNSGLNQPGGAQRTEELCEAAQALREKLDRKSITLLL